MFVCQGETGVTWHCCEAAEIVKKKELDGAVTGVLKVQLNTKTKCLSQHQQSNNSSSFVSYFGIRETHTHTEFP